MTLSEEKNRRIPKKYILLLLLSEISSRSIDSKVYSTKPGNSNQDRRLYAYTTRHRSSNDGTSFCAVVIADEAVERAGLHHKYLGTLYVKR
ncbi:hypothetical protein [Anaplasma phagocytophilum]|uniref:hypothetical protein n=1 Tax=Anaplasma phagocytophilum TaxID=948 RepID=UPI00201A893A